MAQFAKMTLAVALGIILAMGGCYGGFLIYAERNWSWCGQHPETC